MEAQLTGRYCQWCNLKELRGAARPKECSAPDGDGHLWVFPNGHSWQNPPQRAALVGAQAKE